MSDSNRDAARGLGGHRVLTPELVSAVADLVGFRNVLVHEYVDGDDEPDRRSPR